MNELKEWEVGRRNGYFPLFVGVPGPCGVHLDEAGVVLIFHHVVLWAARVVRGLAGQCGAGAAESESSPCQAVHAECLQE